MPTQNNKAGVNVSLLAFFLLTLGSQSVFADTSYADLLADEANGADWLSYSGGYKSERFSPLTQITPANVDQLKVMWAYQMQSTGISGAALQETTPLVAGDVMYITE